MGNVVNLIGRGDQCFPEEVLGWNRVTIRKGQTELRSGTIFESCFSARGRRGVEQYLSSARQKTHFFRETRTAALSYIGPHYQYRRYFSCRRIKNDNNFYLWRLQIIPAPAALAACLVHASQAALFLRPRFRCSFSCSCCRSTAPRRWMLRATTAKAM
ncbi:MAG: hypothetical protein KZQ71_06870 [Candidatus Thiodiazotropha sp. (ex Lucinoma aequizonata)]|nr:hypothetical protein [Candidatus Thiodiazotropha sp. (ex Lucinoma aequizonata)]